MVGWSAASSTSATVTSAANAANGRQRADSSRPVGNNKGVATKIADARWSYPVRIGYGV
jgi:hypothetical protein